MNTSIVSQRLAAVAFIGLFILTGLFVLSGCAPKPLDPAGEVALWIREPNDGISAVSSGLEGLSLSMLPAEGGWLAAALSGAAPDLVLADWDRDVVRASRDGLLLALDEYLPRMESIESMFPSLAGFASDEAWTRNFLPATAYLWGLWVDTDVLSAAGLGVPEDFAAFEAACETLAERGVVPIALGSSFGWPALAWVSVLDLRLNGYEAYRALIDGTRSFDDPGMRPVFDLIERWRDDAWFDPDSASKNWPEALADLAAGRAAFSLYHAGGVNRLGSRARFVFIPVPEIDPAVPRSELAVVQGFAVSAAAPAPEAALAFADAYLAAGVPGLITDNFRISAIRTAEETPIEPGSTAQVQAGMLEAAEGIAPQLDRSLSAQNAYDSNQAMIAFFAAGSRMTGAELAVRLAAIQRRQ